MQGLLFIMYNPADFSTWLNKSSISANKFFREVSRISPVWLPVVLRRAIILVLDQ